MAGYDSERDGPIARSGEFDLNPKEDPRGKTPIRAALDRLDEDLNDLESISSGLEKRLKPVTRQIDDLPKLEDHAVLQGSSPVLFDVEALRERVRRLTARAIALEENLDI